MRDTHLKLAILCGCAIAAGHAAWRAQTDPSESYWLFWLIWPVMALHQLEENVLTELFLGKQCSFRNWARRVGYDISTAQCLVLNCGAAWSLAIAGGLAGARFPVVPLCVVCLEAVNACWHLSVTSFDRRWSPGSLSSVCVTLPFAFYVVHRSLALQWIAPATCLAIFLAACVAHHVFISLMPRAERGRAAAREETPHESKGTTNWIDGREEIPRESKGTTNRIDDAHRGFPCTLAQRVQP